MGKDKKLTDKQLNMLKLNGLDTVFGIELFLWIREQYGRFYDYAIYSGEHQLYDSGHLYDSNLAPYDACEIIMRMYHLNGMTAVAVNPDAVLMAAGE